MFGKKQSRTGNSETPNADKLWPDSEFAEGAKEFGKGFLLGYVPAIAVLTLLWLWLGPWAVLALIMAILTVMVISGIVLTGMALWSMAKLGKENTDEIFGNVSVG